MGEGEAFGTKGMDARVLCFDLLLLVKEVAGRDDGGGGGEREYRRYVGLHHARCGIDDAGVKI